MRPVICMITDGQSTADRAAALLDAVRSAAAAGVHLIQLRERRLADRDLAALARQCVDAVRGTRTRIIVNDRVDVAIAVGAHGVHLRGDSCPPSRVRAIVPPGFLVGRSVHSVGEAGTYGAGGAIDYLVFGTVFATDSKPGREPLGAAVLADAVRATAVPVLAVGGITPGNAAAVAAANAAGIAAIGLFADRTREGLAATVERVTRAFDTLRPGS
jgi:thiamine-phosphate diphosphorylase